MENSRDDPMIGRTISHYEILEKLGQGGMGEVYRARDVRLHREVALKFLPPHLTKDPDANKRFVREARAASALEHSNIGIVHEIDETEDGQLFLVMSYYGRMTLRERTARGKLSGAEAVSLVSQMADGLSRAHDRGIVHRDLKPENVLIDEEGRAKIIDFGLAKLAGATQLTRTGTSVGTVAYMSPEQARGEDATPASDVFALGVLLYELITGRLPFQGDQQMAVIYSIVHEDPEPLRRLAPEAPRELERVVKRAMSKDPAARYAHAGALLEDLRRVGSQLAAATVGGVPETKPARRGRGVWIGFAAGLAIAIAALLVVPGLLENEPAEEPAAPEVPEAPDARHLIAVLPFENLGPAEEAYFADGITEEITARLAGVGGIGVIARTSVIPYKGAGKSVAEIGRELGIDYLLEGTVRWEHVPDGPSRVRVTPQLIRVDDETHLWARIYDEELEEVFTVQSDIAGKVVQQLDLALNENERRSLESRPTDNLEAYDDYLRGKQFHDKAATEENLAIAERFLGKAVELDSTFALAWALLGDVYVQKYWFFQHDEEIVEKARRYVFRARRLDPDHPLIRVGLGYYYYHGELDYDRALGEFERARRLAPGWSEPLAGIGYVERRQGKWKESLARLMEAFELDPRSSDLAVNIGETLVSLHRYAEAERFLERAVALGPDNPGGYIWKALLWIGRTGETKEARRAVGEFPGNIPEVSYFLLAWMDIVDRDYARAVARLRDSPVRVASDHFNYQPKSLLTGQAYAFAGDTLLARAQFDSARVQLERRLEEAPDDARAHGSLGIAYAGLGMKEEAVREGRLAVEILPVTKEAWQGLFRVSELAQTYSLLGMEEEAIDQLELLLSEPGSPVTVPLLRVDPIWDPLRDNPRFRKLLERKPVMF
jgi:TolB-like protein/Flp pilus assembly protein TadD